MQATISGMLLGPFAYAERWGEKTGIYLGLAIERASNAPLVIDSDSTIKLRAAVQNSTTVAAG
ncbi:hypothetical protein [Shinella daejeonensis]|uniref:hypothetical protein n=1 Tax=Shinella daejeonensis TaxID=659017 RepID=UPI0020C7CB8D|nr:hypothetical protein [Shinella daejeonensis]